MTCGKPTAGVPKAGVSESSRAVAVRGRGTPRQSPYTESAPAPQAPPDSYCWGWPPGAGRSSATYPWWVTVGSGRARVRSSYAGGCSYGRSYG